MKNLHSLVVMLTAAIPEEDIVTMLEEAVTEHKILKTEETKQKLASACHKFLLKFKVGDDMKKAQELNTELDSIQQRNEFFETEKN